TERVGGGPVRGDAAGAARALRLQGVVLSGGHTMARKKPAAEAFLQAICAEPDEDAHRLVYADWLDDNGDPARAELIRVQCALAKLGPDDPRRPGLLERERAVFEAHNLPWLVELPEWARPQRPDVCTFRRGFLASVRCTARQWLKGARALRLTPLEG